MKPRIKTTILKLILTLFTAFVPIQALAANYDLHTIKYNTQFYDPYDCSGNAAAGDATPGNDNMESVWNALIVKLKKPYLVAGVMGNMQTESGFDPYIIQGGDRSSNPAAAGSGGYGLVQWTPGSKLIP